MDFSVITNFIKLPKKAIFLTSVISGILLFSPNHFLESLALLDFKSKYNPWIGIAFLFSFGLLCWNIFQYFKEKYEKKKIKEEAEAEIKKNLKRLDNSELANIREFYLQKQNTINMSLEDPIVKGLINKGIIQMVGNEAYKSNIMSFMFSSFKLNPQVTDYFDKYDFTQLSHIERPSWLIEFDKYDNIKKMIDKVYCLGLK